MQTSSKGAGSNETGMHLYRAYRGSGWEDGLRIYEENSASYHVDGELLRLELQGKFVRYSTRNLRLGEEVILRESFRRANDTWIAVFPGGVPAYTEVSDKVQVTAQTDDAVMLSATDVDIPFMEGYARAFLDTEKAEDYYYQAPADSVYSLNDLNQFMESIMLLGLLAAIILFTVVLWGYSFALSREYRKNRKQLILNGSIALVLLLCIPLLHFVSLPSSLLPPNHITDFAYYSAEFGELFAELRSFAEAGNALAQRTIDYAQSRVVWAFVIAGAGIAAAVVLIGAESLTGRRGSRKKAKHMRWALPTENNNGSPPGAGRKSLLRGLVLCAKCRCIY